MGCDGARRLVAAALLLAACAGMTAAQTAAPTSLYTYLFGENSDVVETKNGNYCGFTDAICADLVARTLPKLAYNRNEQMIFYMNVSINGTYEYAPFFPTVDKFTVFELPDSGRLLVEKQPEISISVVTNDGVFSSPFRSMRRGVYFVGFRSLIVKMTDGVISSLDWDEVEFCGTDCTTDQCVDNACGIAVPIGGADECGQACTVKSYITWFGTDAGGRHLTSSSFSMLNIRSWWPFTFEWFINSASKIFEGIGSGGFSELQSAFPLPKV